MKCLVTGGAGFIGSHVIRELVSSGHQVVVLDDLSGGFSDNVPESCLFIQGSILDQPLLIRLFEEHRFDLVYHLAAYAAEGLSHFIKHFNYTNNLIGSVNLINLAIKYEIKCFVFTSSIAVYGKNQLPMTESLTPTPEDPYGISKYAVELELASSHRMFGLNYVVFRPHNVYGEFQNIGDRYRNVVGIFMNQIMQDQPLTIFGDGTQTRAFSYVKDIAGIIAQSPGKPECLGEVFNVGADQPYTVLEIARQIGILFGKEPQFRFLPERNEVQHAYAEHQKIRTFFPDQPETSLTAGLRAMSEWAQKVGPRKSPTFKNIEITRNMPGLWLE